MISPAQIKELTEKTLKSLTEKGPEKAKALKALLDQYGGVSGLAQALKDPELKTKVGTWIDDGKKFVLSQDQVQKFLGNDRVKAIADKVSTTPEQVTKILAEVLPPLIEKIELASGKIPEGSMVSKLLGSVKGFLGGMTPKKGTSTDSDSKPTPS